MDSCKRFHCSDYSVSKYDPIVVPSYELPGELRNQIAPTSYVIILAGIYVNYSRWMNFEIDLAKFGFKNSKKIIVV
ncbi:MAG: TIR domain-containing protein [archaeon]|nr:TIR domain-containing protein [archaeon]